MVKNRPAMWDTRVWSLGGIKKGMATHLSILSWRIPWTEELGRLQSMESQRLSDWLQQGEEKGMGLWSCPRLKFSLCGVRHDWATWTTTATAAKLSWTGWYRFDFSVLSWDGWCKVLYHFESSMCVCVRKRERERERGRQRDWERQRLGRGERELCCC